MAISHNDLFYAKVMLFGEYSIITGSMGLTIPFSHFNGQLSFVNQNSYTDLDFAETSNTHLQDYVTYLEEQVKTAPLPIDLNALKRDVQNGIFFESTIPESYGLGSSGALVAAIYNRYAINKTPPDPFMENTRLLALKRDLSSLESYFHGTSSGIDPLICYLNHPLCIQNEQSIVPVQLPLWKIDTKDAIFLLNTGTPGKTAPLVQQFMRKMEDGKFANMFRHEYTPLVNKCISALVNGQVTDFFALLKQLSQWQGIHFEPMIPKNVQTSWIEGLETDLFTLKLCGSGGGGYVLGFTKNYENTRLYFKTLQKDVIPVYQVATHNTPEPLV
ncbi:MAG: mevalonate kinase [Breznakibacter sp.]